VLLTSLNFLRTNNSSSTISSDNKNRLKNLSIYETIINFFAIITKTLLAIVPIITCLAYG